ncbi:hypothetical protein BV210_15605 [Halorientalis sp. IM1011]|uniref:hypothetical protein n=1 Tax=Halorientalis sp. IM1011 TaxID=1932360 RepID=UPI00097CD450|nr:hypothetical protein [Halorientalis sp. IM1011]AQL44040.1 hypothetical protein BV210_15605 [Halorientalis sp. IM1011]
MYRKLTRRHAVRTIGAVSGIGLLSGCSFGTSGGPDPGDLEIENEDDRAHSVTVIVEKISDDDDDAFGPERAPTPTSTPMSERRNRFTVAAGDTARESGYLDETGSFFVRARTDRETSAQGWIGLYSASGGGVVEEYLEITVRSDGGLTVYAQQAGA